MDEFVLTEARPPGVAQIEEDIQAERVRPAQGGIEALREEFDSYMEEMREFHNMLPDEVFRLLSAWSARASELLVQLGRSDRQKFTAFKNREIMPFIEECDRQFKIHSRLQATYEMDLKMTRGQT